MINMDLVKYDFDKMVVTNFNLLKSENIISREIVNTSILTIQEPIHLVHPNPFSVKLYYLYRAKIIFYVYIVDVEPPSATSCVYFSRF